MSKPTDKFWLVWREDGSVPMHKHDSEFLALKEAERLARECPTKRFYVLAAVTVTTKNDVSTTRLTDNDEVPF